MFALRHRRVLRRVLLLSGFCLLSGCGRGRPAPADPDLARAALQEALTAWREGRPISEKSSLVIVDHEWKAGYRLLRFHLQKDEALGADRRFHVQLFLTDARGTSVERKAIYSVGTGSKTTVIREEDP